MLQVHAKRQHRGAGKEDRTEHATRRPIHPAKNQIQNLSLIELHSGAAPWWVDALSATEVP
jgi:hypothetical protein